MINIEKAATELARLSKGACDDDFGNFVHYFEAHTDEEWDAICARAEQLLPSVKVSQAERAAWARADREFRAEVAHERQQLGYGA